MKFRTVDLLVERDNQTKVATTVWSWVAPVLDEANGGFSEEAGEGVAEATIEPEAGEEFARLSNVYGVHPDTKVPFVELAYGRGRKGIAELAKAINAAKVGVKKAAKDPAPAPVEPKSEPKPEKDPYGDMTVKELQAELRIRELPTAGNKAELLERLMEDDGEDEGQGDENDPLS